jgi:hypothetical protein
MRQTEGPLKGIQCVPDVEQSRYEAHNHFHRHAFWGSGTRQIPYPNDSLNSFPGLKGQEGNADHSTPYSVDVQDFTELYLHSRSTLQWRVLKLSRNFV